MKEKIVVESITLYLSVEGKNVRVEHGNENIILLNQSIDIVSALIECNYEIVVNHYRLMLHKAGRNINQYDLNAVSLSIVLYYLYMYNSWRIMYKKQGNRDLTFEEKDFVNPTTYDILFSYYKRNNPDSWEDICSDLLGLNIDQLRIYYRNREAFYNK